ncbi:MAG TPA: SET domain-containing protein [Flavisolibacter sp.]|nr:SET domain-containing protein [Flavisolibacter sp.]
MNRSYKDLIEIKPSEYGKGLFALRNINEGTIICKANGQELNFAQTIMLGEKESHTLQIDFDKYILCEPPFLYSNHSCSPNCGVNENLELFTLYPIKAGEELCWDYSTSMLERHWTMQCACGKKNCRKVVTDFDLLPVRLQTKYLHLNIVLPFIAHFLEQQLGKTG